MLVRNLLNSVRARRDTVLPRQVDLVVQEAVRRVCRETQLLIAAVTIPGDLGKVGPLHEQYFSFAVPMSNQPVLLASTPDTETKDYLPVAVKALRITLASGKQVRLERVSMDKLAEVATCRNAPTAAEELPSLWADHMGTLVLWPALAVDADIVATVALEPGDEFDQVDLPPHAEPACLELALGAAYELPGSGQDLGAAMRHHNRGLNLCAGLVSQARLGGRTGPRTQYDFRSSR